MSTPPGTPPISSDPAQSPDSAARSSSATPSIDAGVYVDPSNPDPSQDLDSQRR
jgi:hypothetical protein